MVWHVSGDVVGVDLLLELEVGYADVVDDANTI
jgi:hypothetical protein